MYTVFLAGGIASGKSSAAARMAELGAVRIDLDALSRTVLEPGSPCLAEIADAFGRELIDDAGVLDRAALAERVFASERDLAALEAIEHPYIYRALERSLAEHEGSVKLVEIPLLDRMEDKLDLADEVAVVVCPYQARRVRAIARGMEPEEFEARAARQPSDEYLIAHADTVFDNSGTRAELIARIDAWWSEREAAGWGGRA